MSKLKEIDNKAAEKGSGLQTVWQFVKFIVVSLLAFVVQFALLNILKHIPFIHDLYSQDFKWLVFTCTVAEGGLGYFIVNNTANICAQIVSFFVNKEKTFNSDANTAVILPIYLIFTVALIFFSAWLNPALKGIFVSHSLGDDLAANAATMICSAIQFFLYFPVDKLLMRTKKKDSGNNE